MAEPIPQITQDDETKISREELRAVLAALGYDLPVTMADVQEQATNFVKLQDQITVALDELIREKASKDSWEPVDTDRMKALSDMQDKLAKAGGLLQTYAYEEFTAAKKLPTDLGVGQIQQLYRDKLIDDEAVLGKLGALGYRPADAALLLQSYQKGEKGEEAQPLSVSQVQALVKSGVIDRGTAKQKLIALKYTSSDADALLKLVEADGASSAASGSAQAGGTPSWRQTPDPYGTRKAADGATYSGVENRTGQQTRVSRPLPGPQPESSINKLNSTFSNFQDMMAPSLPKVQRLPSPQEFLSDFGNAFDLRMSEASAGLSPDMQAFARSQLKSTLMAKYTAALGNIARNGTSPFKLSAAPVSVNAVQTVTADPGVQAKIARDGGLRSAADAAGFTNEYVAVPKITPLEFLNQELSADTIKVLYEGSRSGAGVGPDKGNTQATLREGV